MRMVRADPLESGRPTRRDRLPIPRSDSIVGFAPVKFREMVCQSRAGRWRPAHDFVGGSCIFCDRVLLVDG